MRHALIVALVLAGCTTEPASGPQATSHVDYHEIQALRPSTVDILLVIDNTSGMTPYQSQIAQLPSIVDGVVATIFDGFPDVHVAVTTNGGAISVLSDTGHWDGSHTRSFNGSLADALAPLVAVGTSNAGPAQPLAAMKTALESAPDFVRAYGALAVVTFSAADDASPSFDYVTWLKGTKSDPAAVTVSGVYAQPSAVLDAFYSSFPYRSTITSIDATDYAPAFAMFGQLIHVATGAICIDLPLDIDPSTPGDQFDCDVSAWDDNGIELARLPACNGADPATGTCWEYSIQSQYCTSVPGEPATAEFHLRGTWRFFHPAIRTQCVVK